MTFMTLKQTNDDDDDDDGDNDDDVLVKFNLCFSCRRRRVDGTDVRVTSRDRAVTSRKQVRREDGVLSNLTASCCQGRRSRDGDTWRRRTGPQLMSVWDSGTTDCLCGERLRDISPTVLVDDPGNVVCWHHRHHHHHHHRHYNQVVVVVLVVVRFLPRCSWPLSVCLLLLLSFSLHWFSSSFFS